MAVKTITMEYDAATRARRAYERAIDQGRAQPGDEELLAGYRALERGKVLIDLRVAIQEGGLDALGRPRLAACRADFKMCEVNPGYYAGDQMVFWKKSWTGPFANSKGVIRVPRSLFAGSTPALTQTTCYAAVPTIPAQHRPGNSSLKDRTILWEAEWMPKAPVDPYLLRHVAGTLYQVEAHWDLTPLEQAVLRSRLMS